MTENLPIQQTEQVQKQNDKEINFRALEAKYKRELEQERQARLQLEEKIRQNSETEDDETSEPYVDHKRLNKKLNKFNENTQSEIQKAMETAKAKAKDELKEEMWLETNQDFYDVVEKHSEKFAERNPHLANTILKMPPGFDRQKLVYQNIKALGLDQPEKKQSSVQEKIDANRRSPYYQPSGVGSPAYASQSDFSPSGQKNAYDKLQELKRNLKL